MELMVTQPALRQALTQVSHLATHTTGALPILSQVLLTVTPGTLEITASNGVLGVHARLDVQADTSGQALLPARLFSELVRDLPASAVHLSLPAPADPTSALIRCGQARVTLKQTAFPVEEFPPVAHATTTDADELLVLDGELLREILNQVCFAAATDESRPVLTGVHLEMRAGEATFAAADAHRLATRRLPVPNPQRTGSWLIPARALRELARLLSPESSVQLLLTGQGRHLLFHTPYLDLATPLLAGSYPDIWSTLPPHSATRAVVETAALASAVRLMHPFGQPQAALTLSRTETETETDGVLTLAVASPDLGTTRMDLPASFTGPEQALTLHLTYLAEALAAIPTHEVRLELVNARHPLLLHPVGAPGAMQVMMPLVTPSTPAPQVAPLPSPQAHAVAAD